MDYTDFEDKEEILNDLPSLDLSRERLREIFETYYTLKICMEGERGLAKFCLDRVITNDDGKICYICIDRDIPLFLYRTGDKYYFDKDSTRLNALMKYFSAERKIYFMKHGDYKKELQKVLIDEIISDYHFHKENLLT